MLGCFLLVCLSAVVPAHVAEVRADGSARAEPFPCAALTPVDAVPAGVIAVFVVRSLLDDGGNNDDAPVEGVNATAHCALLRTAQDAAAEADAAAGRAVLPRCTLRAAMLAAMLLLQHQQGHVAAAIFLPAGNIELRAALPIVPPGLALAVIGPEDGGLPPLPLTEAAVRAGFVLQQGGDAGIAGSLTAPGVGIDGGGAVALFAVRPRAQLWLRSLRLLRGAAVAGGALHNDGGELHVLNCVVENHRAQWGGALYAGGGRTLLEASEFRHNTATRCGGAAYIVSSSPAARNRVNAVLVAFSHNGDRCHARTVVFNGRGSVPGSTAPQLGAPAGGGAVHRQRQARPGGGGGDGEMVDSSGAIAEGAALVLGEDGRGGASASGSGDGPLLLLLPELRGLSPSVITP
jgi:hypothetical protein